MHLCPAPPMGDPWECLDLGRVEADVVGLLSPTTSVPGHIPLCPPDIIRQPSEEEIIKLAPPPKKA